MTRLRVYGIAANFESDTTTPTFTVGRNNCLTRRGILGGGEYPRSIFRYELVASAFPVVRRFVHKVVLRIPTLFTRYRTFAASVRNGFYTRVDVVVLRKGRWDRRELSSELFTRACVGPYVVVILRHATVVRCKAGYRMFLTSPPWVSMHSHRVTPSSYYPV